MKPSTPGSWLHRKHREGKPLRQMGKRVHCQSLRYCQKRLRVCDRSSFQGLRALPFLERRGRYLSGDLWLQSCPASATIAGRLFRPVCPLYARAS